jgi:hypothetical protein
MGKDIRKTLGTTRPSRHHITFDVLTKTLPSQVAEPTYANDRFTSRCCLSNRSPPTINLGWNIPRELSPILTDHPAPSALSSAWGWVKFESTPATKRHSSTFSFCNRALSHAEKLPSSKTCLILVHRRRERQKNSKYPQGRRLPRSDSSKLRPCRPRRRRTALGPAMTPANSSCD